MEALKKEHQGKRVNGGLGFDTDTYEYTATDGSSYGLKHLEDYVCGYCFKKFSGKNAKSKHQAPRLRNVVYH